MIVAMSYFEQLRFRASPFLDNLKKLSLAKQCHLA
jgi:hypothetical protein